MVAEMVRRLNRPQDDDLFEYPLEYYQALTRAHKRAYRQVAQHRPQLLYTNTELTSLDGGTTFTLTDDHYGEMEVYRDPGPPRGEVLVPTNPEFGGHYYVDGRDLKMLYAISSSIHIRWVPRTIADLDEDTDSLLPAYCDEYIIEWACYLLAQKPGFLGDERTFYMNAMREWRGDPEDPSDMGILGVISRQSSHQAYEGLSDQATPWWRGIG